MRINSGTHFTAVAERRLAASVDELLADATTRRPLNRGDSKSGAPLERVEIDGERYVLKHLHVDDDWLMRACGDIGCFPFGSGAPGFSTASRPASTTPWSAPPPGWAATVGARRC